VEVADGGEHGALAMTEPDLQVPASDDGARSSRRGPGWRGLALLVLVAGATAALVVLWVRPATAQSEEDRFDNEWCLTCHGVPGMQAALPGGEVLDLTVDRAALESSVHGAFDIPCVLCHTDIQGVPHDPITAVDRREFTLQANRACIGCHEAEAAQTSDNQHAAALAAGNRAAAVCTDCHGAHDASRPAAHSPEVPLICSTCHSEIYDLYRESVHGAALIEGNQDVPTCTDCHGVHNVEGPADSPFRLFSPQICARCHADETLMGKYGISTNVFETYVSDFHGSTVMLFQRFAPDQGTNKPVCIDCHGVHAIRPPNDPESSVFQGNLLRTCQRCHPDATEDFPASWLSHYSPEPGKATLVFAVQTFYKFLIPLLIGGMALYVVVHRIRLAVGRRRERRSA
jgi:predicted CXXCH cytochrome family protein